MAKSLKKTVADTPEMQSSSLVSGPPPTRLWLFPNDCVNSTVMKVRSAESSVGAEGYVITAESSNPAVLIGALVMFMANWLSH